MHLWYNCIYDANISHARVHFRQKDPNVALFFIVFLCCCGSTSGLKKSLIIAHTWEGTFYQIHPESEAPGDRPGEQKSYLMRNKLTSHKARVSLRTTCRWAAQRQLQLVWHQSSGVTLRGQGSGMVTWVYQVSCSSLNGSFLITLIIRQASACLTSEVNPFESNR